VKKPLYFLRSVPAPWWSTNGCRQLQTYCKPATFSEIDLSSSSIFRKGKILMGAGSTIDPPWTHRLPSRPDIRTDHLITQENHYAQRVTLLCSDRAPLRCGIFGDVDVLRAASFSNTPCVTRR